MTKMEVRLIVRPANSADSPRLTELAREAKASWGYPVAWLEAWRDELSITPAYIETHTVLVAQSAESPHAVIGMCALEDHVSSLARDARPLLRAHLAQHSVVAGAGLESGRVATGSQRQP